MPRRPPSTTRRTALGGLVATAFVLTGCDVDDLRPPDDAEGPAPTPTDDSDVDPDQALVEDVVAQVTRAWGVVISSGLGTRLSRLQRMHEAHLEVLDATLVKKTAPPSSESAAKRYRRVLQHEHRLERNLASAAVEARSGALARLLGSMSAAVAQHLAALPDGDKAQ